MKRLKIGDVFEIPLSNGNNGYGQYLFQSKMGPLIQVFDVSSNKIEDVDEIIHSPKQFPPILCGLKGAVYEQIWTVIGNVPVKDFIHPIFVTTLWDKKGNAIFWYTWDGQKFSKIDKVLPKEYKKCEFLSVYPPQMVAERIETKEPPFPYGDLISKNKFTPK